MSRRRRKNEAGNLAVPEAGWLGRFGAGCPLDRIRAGPGGCTGVRARRHRRAVLLRLSGLFALLLLPALSALLLRSAAGRLCAAAPGLFAICDAARRLCAAFGPGLCALCDAARLCVALPAAVRYTP